MDGLEVTIVGGLTDRFGRKKLFIITLILYVDRVIIGSFWLGTMFGAALSLVLLDKDLFSASLGWRLAFGLGAVLGLGILLVRRVARPLSAHNEKVESRA